MDPRGPPPGPPGYLPPKPKPKPRLNPQALVSKFWSKYHSKTPGKVTSIFPRSLYETLLPETDVPHPKIRNAAQDYEKARSECRAMVRAIVAECERTNAKFSDPDFDVENDYSIGADNCLFGLVRDWESDSEDEFEYENKRQKISARQVKLSLETLKGSGVLANDEMNINVSSLRRCLDEDASYYRPPPPPKPGSVHRLSWIFESPQFTVDGFSSSDIKQGNNGDCWWLAAVATIAHRKDLMDKVCVARDEECGVYGFVFHRDGEWISTVVDDNLYLREKDFGQDSDIYDATGRKAKLYKKQKQSGSESLFFAKCADANETWLPLLEKAFAKVHGDYEAIDGGWAGTAVEDLTGGVTTVVAGNRVLRKEKLWREMLSTDQEDGEFVFGLSATGPGEDSRKNGLVLRHAYSILKATEVEDEEGRKLRLVKIRNPWGQRSESGLGEWYGPWSDGSREWTPYMIQKLRHEFGDDGVFWMSYSDVLDNFKWIYRTRLFDKRWTVVQQWTSLRVSWVTGYLKTKFIIEIKKEGRVVIVLSQLDERYFRGLMDQYEFTLQFLLKSSGSTTPICQVRPVHTWDRRSVNCEVELEPGTYEVIPKIDAERFSYRKSIDKVVKMMADRNPQKLRQVGLQYDLAHAKGGVLDEDEKLQKKREQQKKKKRKEKKNQVQVHEMEDAMRRMEMAMMQMRSEMIKELDRLEENQYRRDHRSKRKEAANDKVEDKKGNEEKGPPMPPIKPPPGFWPEDTIKTENEMIPPSPPPPPPIETTAAPKREPTPLGPVEPPEKSENDKQKEEGTSPGVSRGTMTVPTDKPEYEMPVSEPDIPKDHPPTPPTLIEPQSKANSAASSDSDPDSDSASEVSEVESESEDERRPKKKQPWNAVCVLGLRVYAQHADVKVRLAESDNDDEEGAGLVTDGKAVGPTS
ncbi:Fc.00g008080.m01.CDS01 [Cosmosporella sp. VM-42]